MNKKNSKGTYLPEHCLGQFKNPEVQAKAVATRKKNLEEKKRRKEAAQTGFSLSVASDPHAQAAMVNKLWGWAMGDDMDMAKFAMKMLMIWVLLSNPQRNPQMKSRLRRRLSFNLTMLLLY